MMKMEMELKRAMLFVAVMSLAMSRTCFAEDEFDVSAMIIMGDSLADAGNNNMLNTSARANFEPYGVTFFHRPTGRFTDGRTVFDMLAAKLGFPFPPPYLAARSDFSRGVNFASGGSGLLDSTSKSLNIIPFSKQIRFLKRFSSDLEKKIGRKAARTFLQKSLFAITVGGNDIGLNYLQNSTLQKTMSAKRFVRLLISTYHRHIKKLYAIGARRMLLIDMPMLGCTPNSRLAGLKQYHGKCLDTANQMASFYNIRLRQMVKSLNNKLFAGRGKKILVTNTYGFMSNVLRNPKNYGFSEVKAACCGSGELNARVGCGKNGTQHCANIAEFYFWDGTHPTEHVYRLVSRQIWDGPLSFIFPTNLTTLLRQRL